jgi:hypothetical protein
MVYVTDEGSEFDAPIDVVWSYIFGGGDHDKSHKSTRNPTFEKVSNLTIIYGAERYFRGVWAPHRLRITMIPPVAVATEWLEGVLEGSALVYVYSPRGKKTRIDVFGEFRSTTLPPDDVEAAAREWLAGEFDEDALSVLAHGKKEAGSGGLGHPRDD